MCRFAFGEPTPDCRRHQRGIRRVAGSGRRGLSADEAYAKAGFKPHRHNAARMSTNEHIQARDELVAKAAAKAGVTVRLNRNEQVQARILDRDEHGGISV
jgi:hypothetical protein